MKPAVSSWGVLTIAQIHAPACITPVRCVPGPYERIERNTRRKAAADDTGATMKDLSRRSMIGDLMVQALALAAMVVVAAMVFYVR